MNHVTGQTYPSGHAVAYNYDAAGRLADADATHQAFTGNLGDGINRTYALGVKYEERGMLAREGFGTSSPLWHKRQYNVRGQVWNIQLGAGASATGENHSYPGGRVQLYYGGAAEGQSSATNNGNVTAQYRVAMSGAGGGPSEWWAGYSYDALNRLTQVTEYSGAAGWQATGQQAYEYDRWGNRTVHQTNTWGVGIPKPNLAADASTNRLLPGAGQAGGFSYDAAGNLTTDTVTVAGGGQRFYDAENRIWKAQNGDGSFTEYRYDGDGRRIKRFVNANAYQQPETWQIYGMDGELAAEYRQGYAPFVPSKEYGYRNGQLLITASNGDEGRVTRFVEQLYLRAAVGFQPAEVQTQVNNLANAGAQGELPLRTAAQNAARQIFQASSLPAGDLVVNLYLGVLQRYGDAGGISYWTSIAQSDRNAAIEGFVTSGEFYERVQVLFGREVSDTERTDNFTKYLYTVILNRGASAEEKSARRTAVDGASAIGQAAVVTNAKDFVRSLFNGAEYAGRGRTDAMFVSDLYYACVRYAPDGNGWSYWTGQVGSQGRAAVLEVFLNAGPFDVQAGALYREVLWLVADHLGTPRMIAERTGQPAGIKQHDYLPFGEELFGGISGRDASHGYGAADSARQQFTLYERDDETGLDYAQARYYASGHGRFTSVDPKIITTKQLVNPQRWDRYTYAINNPVTLYDPNGEEDEGEGGGKVIDVFLVFTAKDIGQDDKTLRANWNNMVERAKREGIELRVFNHEESTSGRIIDSLRASNAVVIIGHGRGIYTDDGQFQATELGTVGSNARPPRQGEEGITINGVALAFGFGPKPEVKAETVGLFVCNSADQLTTAFNVTNPNTTFVVNDGGKQGETDGLALNNAGLAFVGALINGSNVEDAVKTANKSLDNFTKKNGDPTGSMDGDQLRRIRPNP